MSLGMRGSVSDGLGRPSSVVDHTLGRSINYGYDASGNRASMQVDTGESVAYRWDPAGRLSEVVDAEGAVTLFGYDAAGRRSRVMYGNGTTATWGYDAVGQVLSIVYATQAGDVLTAFGYDYDAAGNRKSKAFADGTKERYGYDALNRLTSADYPSGRHVEYGYDAVGNRLSMTDTASTGTRWAVTASASTQWAPASAAVGAPDATACVSSGSWMARDEGTDPPRPEWLELGYARAEQVRGVRIHETNLGGFVTSVELVDEGGTVHTIFSGPDRTVCGGWLVVPVDLTSYKVKKVRVRTQIAGAEGIDAVGLDVSPTQTYQYNAFNQLTGVTGGDGSSTTFGYDGNGNQVRKTETPAGGSAQTTQYVYNDDNRLVGIALPNGQSDAFEYDANGLRTKKADSFGTTRYLLDGLSVVAQYAPDGTKQAFYTQSLARIDEVLSVVNSQGKYWYQADALGSTYALADNAGNLAAQGGYDVFGAPVAVSGSVGQPFGFTGREHDLDSGLVYARARYLNPATGRWDRPDPYSVSGVMLPTGVPFPRTPPWDARGDSAYGYSHPTSATDPYGLWAAGIGGGADAHFLGVGAQFYVYFVWDNHGGTGLLFEPAFRLGMAITAGVNPGFFVNPQANTIEDLRGLGISAAVELLVVTVGAQASVVKDDDGPIQGLLWGGGASGFGLGFGIGAYVAVGYAFLWEWTHPAGPTPCK